MPERDRAREEYRVNCDPEGIIPRIRNFCLDMDGTVYLDKIIPPRALQSMLRSFLIWGLSSTRRSS